MTLNKNHRSRLKTAVKQLDKVVDILMQLQGNLWPKELRDHHSQVETILAETKALSGTITSRLSVDAQAEADDGQTDIEDAIEANTMTAAQAEAYTKVQDSPAVQQGGTGRFKVNG